MITKDTLSFLKAVGKNNNKEWFTQHKSDYTAAHQNMKDFMAELETLLTTVDKIEETKIFRIYRDVRFSKDKTPYKNFFSGYFKRAGEDRRGSYYVRIEPGATLIGGGFYGPNKEDLHRIRREFERDVTEIEKLVDDANFKDYFGELLGDGVASAPRDFDKNHPNIKWIRKKQFYAFREFTDKEVTGTTFTLEVMKTFETLRPFFDYMTDILTTDLNGESILKK